MCGIVGYAASRRSEADGGRLHRMLGTIAHRGPDDAGYMLAQSSSGRHLDLVSDDSDPRLGDRFTNIATALFAHDVGLGHRRYSVVDLSTGGHQPMWSACEQACLAFNGEIYNYVELRQTLSTLGHRFATDSDTEVLLAGYIEWGTDLFTRLDGPFALAIYDTRRRAVLLARDRLGKSPLYVAEDDGTIYWGSEIKALLAGTSIPATDIDGEAVHEFLAHGWRDRGRTFWNRIEDFPPASYLWLDGPLQLSAAQRYWQLPETRLTPAQMPFAAARDRFAELLCKALEIRLRSDVAVAFELSGGLDSSSLVALAAGRLGRRITTYTIQFDEPGANEEPFAREVQERYRDRLDYRVIKPEPDEFWADADDFVWIEEEPFHAPNLLTNRNLRRRISNDGYGVVITGAAGDEVLAGYPGDYLAPYLASLLARGKLASFVRELTQNSEISAGANVRTLLRSMLARLRGKSIPRVGKSGHWYWLSELTGQPSGPFVETSSFDAIYAGNLHQRKMNYWLRSGNKADFSIPVEARSPFLDPQVVDFCAALPAEYLISNGWHKHLLREAMVDDLPKSVRCRRQKMGFPFPMKAWLERSEPIVRRNLLDSDCPYFRADRFLNSYTDICTSSPILAWRLISVGLWWQRVVRNRPLIGADSH